MYYKEIIYIFELAPNKDTQGHKYKLFKNQTEH